MRDGQYFKNSLGITDLPSTERYASAWTSMPLTTWLLPKNVPLICLPLICYYDKEPKKCLFVKVTFKKNLKNDTVFR